MPDEYVFIPGWLAGSEDNGGIIMTNPGPDAGSGSGRTVEDAVQQLQVLIDAHRRRTRRLFAASYVTMLLGLAGIICGAALAYAGGCLERSLIVGISGAIAASLGLILRFIAGSSQEQDRSYLEELRIEGLDNYPDQQFERARLKIQYYMHENLKQVHSIYGLTAIAMILGFVIILAGVALAYVSPKDDAKLLASVVATLAGVVVQFIGRSFLSVYKSATAQATHYVSILERINAVGMSKLLVESIQGDLKDQTLAEIATGLLSLPGSKPDATNSEQPSS